jgi:hypothetical protein
MPHNVKSAGPDAENGAAEPNQLRSARSKHPPLTLRVVSGRRGRPVTLLLGLGLILVCEALLAIDVTRREVAVLKSEADVSLLPAPDSALQHLARRVAIDMTPLCWIGYLLVADGLLAGLRRRSAGQPGSPLRTRPKRFTFAFVTSVGLWLFFDWVNFSFIHAWTYHGLPTSRLHEYVAKFIAFGAISLAMFLAAELYQRLGLRRMRLPPLRIGQGWRVGAFLAGFGLLLFPFVVQRPIGCLTLWVSLIFVLDPVNAWAGAPSLLRDWQAGRWGRTVALMAGGATCGILWEFWNYWAAAKWTYDLPFLGSLEPYRAFEMPLPGFLGFLPFALECWVAFQAFVVGARALGLRFVEPLPDHDGVL